MKKSIVDNSRIGLLVFHVGDYCLGINLENVCEISSIPAIKAVPSSHPVIVGLFELRRGLIPAISLRTWLDLEHQDSQEAKVIIARFLDLTIGFIVDRVEGIKRIPRSDIEPPGPIKRYSSQVLGTVKNGDNGRLITLIDYEHILKTVNLDLVLTPDETGAQSK
jgi:two-component system, chemotaxis family, chemotaxis protein CheV